MSILKNECILASILMHPGNKIVSFVVIKASYLRFNTHTKILESWTKRCVCVFERIFNDSSPKSIAHTLENYFKNAHATLCSGFQKLRLESMHFNRNVSTTKQKGRACVCSRYSSRVCLPNLVLTPLKSRSNIHARSFVRSSKIIVLGSMNAQKV